jgi:hypothetical protein
VAGASRLDLFTANAIALIYRASEGIPRLINNLCDNALLTGYAMNARLITSQIIAEVAESLDLLQPMIEDDPREVMAGNLPAAPILREEVEDAWLTEESQPVAKRRRRRERGSETEALVTVNKEANGNGNGNGHHETATSDLFVAAEATA